MECSGTFTSGVPFYRKKIDENIPTVEITVAVYPDIYGITLLPVVRTNYNYSTYKPIMITSCSIKVRERFAYENLKLTFGNLKRIR